MRKLILCKLKRNTETRYAWVPAEFAKIGAPLKIILESGEESTGWYVIRVRNKTKFVEKGASDESEGSERRLAA
jgi:hypothetical protein